MAAKKLGATEKYDEALRLAKEPGYDPDVVLPMLEMAHENGDHRATYALATWYFYGHHLDKDIKRAVRMMKVAASANVPDAMYDLAIMYETGEGVGKNRRKAFLLYVGAALRGEKQSVYEISRCLWYGIGTAKDRELSEVWRLRAAELGTDDSEEVDD
ncbi:MAG: sel1 repeat family protein [Amphiplicatus sp.]|nr:sel1 repeat family protein [Amphiplicatus sp.]